MASASLVWVLQVQATPIVSLCQPLQHLGVHMHVTTSENGHSTDTERTGKTHLGDVSLKCAFLLWILVSAEGIEPSTY
jgi:hypothetical protein